MKNEIITKVNKIGKAGHIIAKIAKVVIAIGAIACLVSGIILTALPDDMVVIHVEGKAAVEINMPMVGNNIVTEDGSIVIGVDMTTVLLVLLVFMLSMIFSYGTSLQQESDETL